MAMKKQIKNLQMRLLPPSSRSFHGATYDIRQDIQHIRQELTALQDQMARHTEQMHHRMDSLSSDIAIHDAHMKLYNDVFFRKDEETPHEMRKRFFRSLPGPMNPSVPSSSPMQSFCTGWKISAGNSIWITGFGSAALSAPPAAAVLSRGMMTLIYV